MTNQKTYHGTREEIRVSENEYIRSIQGLILNEEAEEATVNYMNYGGYKLLFSFRALFIGMKSVYLASIVDVSINSGSLFIFEGKWDSKSFILAAHKTLVMIYPNALFKHKRGILLDFGTIAYGVLVQFNGLNIEECLSGGDLVQLPVLEFENLTDYEWIEDVMEQENED
ncbi:hypothetical protein QYF50_07060 [Paenibacillus vini]|uniref:hypothetical protein n=1 Tax=Paenibacillus vini TaxID=1476024 RepID=UPI0025B682EB|nr:hypothetical protein [Paenibacillus vini]MDN4067651.1 hypothetical protein [Paenibacillus vini]